jgi:hypothetical protein
MLNPGAPGPPRGGGDIPATIAEVRALVKTAKSNHTRARNAIKKLCDDLVPGEVDNTRPAYTLITKLEMLEILRVRLNDLYEALVQKDNVQANKDTWEANSKEIDEATDVSMAMAQIVLGKIPNPPIPVGVPAQPIGQGGLRPPPLVARANVALKPEMLSLDSSPLELKAWIGRFEAFYRTSNLQLLDIRDQQAYLLSHLNPILCLMMEPKFDHLLPVFGQISCIGMLNDAFRERFPIFHRREMFFNAKFSGDIRELPSFLTELEGLADVAEVQNLTRENLIAFKALSAITDRELRRLAAREEDLTLRQFRALALQRVREAENLDRPRGSAPHPEVNLVGPDTICHYCKKAGHIQADCFKLKRDKAAGLTTGPAPGPRPRPKGRPARRRPAVRATDEDANQDEAEDEDLDEENDDHDQDNDGYVDESQ